jgi:hypothetical protein
MSISKKVLMFILFLTISWMVVNPAFASPDSPGGMALKFFGEGHAGLIDPAIKTQMDKSELDLTGFDCFQLPVLDPATRKKLGTGVDCLRGISASGDLHGDGLQLEALTFFILRNGMIVNHGCTSVRPFFEGIGDTGVTHMTGSIGPSEFGVEPTANSPVECTTNPGIVYSTGRYKDINGEARLSGAVNLNNAGNGIIKFSCLFILNYEYMKTPF